MAIPPPTTVNSLITVTYSGRLYGQRILNDFCLRTVTASGATNLFTEYDDIGNKLSDAGNVPLSNWVGNTSSAFIFDEVRLQAFTYQREVYKAYPIGVVGGVTPGPMTANVACSVTKRTAYSGRSQIGRVQLAGLPDGSVVDGQFDGAYLTAIASAMSAFTGLFTGDILGGVYAWTLPTVSTTGDPSQYDVYDMVPQSTVRTMHRRTVGLGI